MAPSQKIARFTFSLNNFGKRWSFPVKRPRTKWRKPRASFVELVHILKESSSSSSNLTMRFPNIRYLDATRKRESLEAEVIEFLPSYLCEEHFSWSAASTFSSSVKPSNSEVSFRRSSSGTIAVYSPTPGSEEDFSSDDVMSFVVSNDCCDVESFLAHMPSYSKKDITKTAMAGEGNAYSVSERAERGNFGTVSTEQSKKVTSVELGEEDYRIDVSDFEPDEVVLETDSKSCEERLKRGLSLRLDYEAVMSAWSHGGCLWADGRRPEKMQVHVEQDASASSWPTVVL